MIQVKCDVCGQTYAPVVAGYFANPKKEGSTYPEQIKLSVVFQATDIQHETQESTFVTRDICPGCAKKLMDMCLVDVQGARTIHPLLNRFFNSTQEEDRGENK